jgi:predicted nucleotidyltransferase
MARHVKMQRAIEQIVNRVVERYQPEKIILFGSYAHGTPDAGSDLDMLIIKDTKERPIDRRVTVRRIAYTPRRGLPFSPLVITPQELARRLEMDDPFYHEIMAQGEILYAQS